MKDSHLYLEKVQARLRQYQAGYDKLVAKAKESEADAKLALNDQLKELSMRLNEAKDQLKTFKSASLEAQQMLQQRLDMLLDNIQKELKIR